MFLLDLSFSIFILINHLHSSILHNNAKWNIDKIYNLIKNIIIKNILAYSKKKLLD